MAVQQTKSLTVGGRVVSIVTNTPVHSDALLQSANASLSDVLPGKYGFSDLVKQPVPLIARPGAMYSEKDNLYGNRPKIEIIPKGSSATTAGPISTFDHWILGAVQETDAEKADVQETFGLPFFFASGRFTRRVTFAGVVRGAPVNADSERNDYMVTQAVLLRLFYDNYMRMSVQALKGWFTRITVNKEIYEGYVSTMNVSTDAQNEQFIPFTFTLLCTNRTNDMLDTAGKAVLGIGGNGIVANQNTAQANAEVSDVLAKTSIKALPAVADIGTLNFNNPVPTGNARQLINLTFAPRPELLSVQSSLPGIEPVYDSSVFGGRKTSVPLHGSVPPLVGPFPIDFKVTDYWTLYNAVLAGQQATTLLSNGVAQSVPAGQTVLLPGAATFSVTTASKQKFTLVVRFHLTPPANIQVGKVRAYLGGTNQNEIGDGSVIPPNSDNTEIVLGSVPARQAYDNQNTVSLQLRYFLTTPDGSPVPASALDGATIVYDIQKVYPALGDALLPVDNSHDRAICAAVFTVNNVLTAVPEENSLHNEFSLQLKSDELLNAATPFAEADRVVIQMRPTIALKGYPTLKVPTLSLVLQSDAPPTRACLKTLSFLGSDWKPVQTQVLVTDTKISQRLDQFGFLKFAIKTTESQDVPASVYAAIRRSTLLIQTNFASQAQGTARIDPIPLSGSSYGGGELTDPATAQRIFIRNRLASLVFNPTLGALVLTIEVNTSYQSGFAAYLYSARFWSYISEVITASLDIPASTSIVPPISWGK